MVAELDIDQRPFRQVTNPMTIYHSLLRNELLQVVQAYSKRNKYQNVELTKRNHISLTDMYDRVPINVCNVESINCALTPKSHNFISPIEKFDCPTSK